MTNSEGPVDLVIPQNRSGLGYVCYSVAGLQDDFALTPRDTTQVFEGAADLDIMPAVPGHTASDRRIHSEAGTSIQGQLNFDVQNWTPRPR